MTPEQVKLLKTKSKDELIKIITNLDRKLFRLIKDLFRETGRNDTNLNDFFAETIEYNDKIKKEN